MTDDETRRLKAVPQQKESLFSIGMIRIVDQAGMLVEKSGLRFLE